MNTFKKIKEILQEENEIKNISINSSIKNDLGLDSLDVVDRLLSIEEYFTIEISDSELEKIETIKDLVSCVDRLK